MPAAGKWSVRFCQACTTRKGYFITLASLQALAVADRLGLTNQLSQKQSDLLRLLQ